MEHLAQFVSQVGVAIGKISFKEEGISCIVVGLIGVEVHLLLVIFGCFSQILQQQCFYRVVV